METPLWLFQRDEVDVLESELDALWDRYTKPGKERTREAAVLKEYADTEDWAETELLLRLGPAAEHGEPCTHEEDRRRAFEQMPLAEYLRQGLQRDPLYAETIQWARGVSELARVAEEGPDMFRARVNALLVPVKLAFALMGESHEGRAAKETARADYELTRTYLARAAESLSRLGHGSAAQRAGVIEGAVAIRRKRLDTPNA